MYSTGIFGGVSDGEAMFRVSSPGLELVLEPGWASDGPAAEEGASGMVEDVENESEPATFWVESGERSMREVSKVELRDGWVIL